jgi:hypothetical protein
MYKVSLQKWTKNYIKFSVAPLQGLVKKKDYLLEVKTEEKMN